MARTPEGIVKDDLKKMLKRYPWVYYHMPVMNGMGAPTLDFILCVNGRFFGIETKAPGGKPTKRQEITMSEMRLCGAYVFVVSCQTDIDLVEAYIRLLEP